MRLNAPRYYNAIKRLLDDDPTGNNIPDVNAPFFAVVELRDLPGELLSSHNASWIRPSDSSGRGAAAISRS